MCGRAVTAQRAEPRNPVSYREPRITQAIPATVVHHRKTQYPLLFVAAADAVGLSSAETSYSSKCNLGLFSRQPTEFNVPAFPLMSNRQDTMFEKFFERWV